MVRYLFYTIGDLTYQSLLVIYLQLPTVLEDFLHPQPEDAPCHGDRDTLITHQRLART